LLIYVVRSPSIRMDWPITKENDARNGLLIAAAGWGQEPRDGRQFSVLMDRRVSHPPSPRQPQGLSRHHQYAGARTPIYASQNGSVEGAAGGAVGDADCGMRIFAPANVPHSCTWPLLTKCTTVATTSSSLAATKGTARTRSRSVHFIGAGFLLCPFFRGRIERTGETEHLVCLLCLPSAPFCEERESRVRTFGEVVRIFSLRMVRTPLGCQLFRRE